MGNWSINIQGTGPHHNGKPEIDADQAAAELVAKLQRQGHSIDSACFFSGGKLDLLEAVKPAKSCRVIVNGNEVQVAGVVSYEELTRFIDSGFAGLLATIAFSRARYGRHGVLAPGETVEACEGTIFDVCYTGNA